MGPSKRKFSGHTFGVCSILLLLFPLLLSKVWPISAAASGIVLVVCFLGALAFSVAAALMASRWWLCLSCTLFALYLFVAIGHAIWEWKATGH